MYAIRSYYENGEVKHRSRKTSSDLWVRKLRCSCGSSFRKNRYHKAKDGTITYNYLCYNQVNNGKASERRSRITSYNVCYTKLLRPEIISQLELYGITAARKALYQDIEALKTYGLDIISTRGNNSGYYVASREFELPELKLLADAVTSSRFLTEKKSRELLKKIEGLSSIYDGKQIQRQVFVADRVKAMNEKIYLSVDTIHRAIAEKKQISFKYRNNFV